MDFWSKSLVFTFICIWCSIGLGVRSQSAVTCKTAYIYGDHMVLQREPYGALLWGYANLSFNVNVTFKGINYTTQGAAIPSDFGPDVGVWQVVLPPQPAGGPHDISITCFDNTGFFGASLQLQDILFGDVWICSGQSNMAFAVRQAMNSTAELAASVNYPNVRVLSVKQAESDKPYYDLQSNTSLYHSWAKASPESIGAKASADFLYFSAVCWFYGRDLYDTYQVPMGMISSNWGGTPVEAWSSPGVIRTCKTKSDAATKVNATEKSRKENNVLDKTQAKFGGPHGDSVLWNAMIHPFLNMTIKGAIWYQGEANTPDPEYYRCLFQSMISDWRLKWYEGSAKQTNPYFPFGFVQLCTSGEPEIGAITNYPITRWHQTDDVGYVPNAGVPDVFMAVALDLSDLESPFGSIHPRYKQDVAARLVQAARGVAYREKGIVYQGPFPTKFTVNSQAGTIDVQYNNEGSGPIQLVGPDTNTFEVCCSRATSCADNDVWIGTTVTGLTGSYSLKMTYNCLGLNPVAIRYLWKDYACTYKKCTVYNKDGLLPAPPFILSLK